MEQRVKYECSGCGYKFTRKVDAKVLRCPYCSKQGTVEVLKGQFASKLLDDVSKGD